MMNKDIDLNKLMDLRDGDNIEINMAGFKNRISISTEKTPTHGDGMPSEYNFPLSPKEKALIIWLVADFKIEQYKREIEQFCDNHGTQTFDFNAFVKNIRNLKLSTKMAKKIPNYPELTLYGSIYDIDDSRNRVKYTLCFLHNRLTEIKSSWNI